MDIKQQTKRKSAEACERNCVGKFEERIAEEIRNMKEGKPLWYTTTR